MAIPLASLPDSSITLSKGSQSGFETPSSEIAILNPETNMPNNLIVNDPHRYPLWRKSLIVFVTSWIALSSASSSTALFPAAPEIAAEFGTTVEVLNITNAGTFLAMGVSSLIWGPVSKIVGRRVAYHFAIFFLFSSSVGVALAPNFQTFIALRLFGGLQGTYFMVAGTTILADIFEPLHRGTAVGFFMSGTVIGPAFGPCIGGILVTFTNWRAIFWLQSAMTGLGFVLSILFVPSITSKAELFRQGKLDVAEAVGYFNPLRVLRLFVYPNIILTDIACGFLSWSQYSLLTAPRTLINPRFHLTTPLVSGLFYIAPGAGFLAGTICGGKFADMTVRKRIKIRGYRLPQDRLNSGLLAFAVVVPVASLIYGWGLQYTVGGLALPIISIFWAGFGLMAAFSSLNTYCSEVLPAKRTEVITGKYLVQYLFCAGSSASILPLIKSIGVGLATTIGVVLSLAAGGLVMTTAKHGLDMQTWVEKRLKREAKE